MKSKFLITRPTHDRVVNYLSCWSEEIIKVAGNKNISFSDFKDEKANRQDVENFIKIQNPRLVMFNGHGDVKTICGYKDEPLI